MGLRVVFADDNYLVREGVAALLAEVDEIELIETVADPHSLLKSVAEHRPEAVLTDIRMPPTHTTEGIDAAKQIRAEYRTRGWWSFPSTSKRTTPSTFSRTGWPAWATC
jgi:DNA-binding NarL/FixJ family response regulator